jgi:hypothetical protein
MSHELACFQKCRDRIIDRWPGFLAKRDRRLEEQRRFGSAAERVAENIVEDLFTDVLDWPLGNVNHQVGYADLLVTGLGIKYLIIETKRPGALSWNRTAVDRALDQAHRYAHEQRVHSIGVSDGAMLYAADVVPGGLRPRAFAPLDAADPPVSLWWLSVHGVYRTPTASDAPAHLPVAAEDQGAFPPGVTTLLHPKYKLPAVCFGYVGNPANPATWKLPYLLATGAIDAKRLPKAIQAIISNYRGAKVATIPEAAIPDVLVRLGKAAHGAGKMPGQSDTCALVYQQLENVLTQLNRAAEVA